MYNWPNDWVIKQSFNPQTMNKAYWFIDDNASLEVWGGDKHYSWQLELLTIEWFVTTVRKWGKQRCEN